MSKHNLDARVTVLEQSDKENSSNIRELNTRVGHIEDQMDDLKTIAKSNTDANQKTNETLTDIHILIKESRAFAKGMAWLIGAIVSIVTIVSIVNGS